MKLKTLSAIALSAMSITIAFVPELPAFAGNNLLLISESTEDNYKDISPRYSYIQSADIGVYPNKTETPYSMNIRGTSEVTSVTGTMTLYKKTAAGTYEEVESEELNLTGSNIRHKGKFKSYGSGDYKLEFSGTVHAKSGSETVTFRHLNSY